MPAFVVLLVGTVLSSAVFIGELIVNCLVKRKGKRIRAVGESEGCIIFMAHAVDIDLFYIGCDSAHVLA
jgi:hypothetical protein